MGDSRLWQRTREISRTFTLPSIFHLPPLPPGQTELKRGQSIYWSVNIRERTTRRTRRRRRRQVLRNLWNPSSPRSVPTLSSTTWWLRSPWSSSPSSRWTTTSQLWTAGRQWGLQDCQDVCPHCQDQRSGRESHWDGYWLLWPRMRTPGRGSTRGWRTTGEPTWTQRVQS